MDDLAALLRELNEPVLADECTALLARCGVAGPPLGDDVLAGVPGVEGVVGDDGLVRWRVASPPQAAPGAAGPLLGTVRPMLADAALRPGGDRADAYLLRCGVRHLLAVGRRNDAIALLTDFDLLMTRFRRLDSTGRAASGWYDDWTRVVPSDESLSPAARVWWEFARSNRHHFRKEGWESWRVLFQAAMDHADDSVVTAAAEEFWTSGRCDWAWLRWQDRPRRWSPDRLTTTCAYATARAYGESRMSIG